MLEYEIAPADLNELLHKEGSAKVVLLDVREPAEYATARIEGSVHIPMGEIPGRQQEFDPDAHIVAICHLGVRSLNVTAWLRNQGFERVQSLCGGIDAWSAIVDPTVPRY